MNVINFLDIQSIIYNMNFEKKINNNNEIDLIEISIIIWKHKLKVFLFVAFALVAMLFFITNQNSNKPYYIAKTEIRPISTFKEFEYESYNGYLNYTNKENVYYSLNLFKEDKEELEKKKNYVLKNVDAYNAVDNSSFKKIDKEYLFSLFVDKLNQNSFYLNLIKKFNLIEKDIYKNEQDFENAALKLASSINVGLNKSINYPQKKGDIKEYNLIFETSTSDKEFWKKTLILIEENANIEIQNYLIESFNRLISHQVKLKNYKIEDINILMSSYEKQKDNLNYTRLEKLKNEVMQNKNIERLQNEFKFTPIMKSNKFKAGNILVDTTSFENKKTRQNKKSTMLIIAGVFGLVIGIFYVIILESIRNRTKN